MQKIMHLFCKMVGFSSLTEFTVYFTLNHKQIADWILFLSFLFFFLPFWAVAKVLVPRFCCRESGGGVGEGGVRHLQSENDAWKS